jgi:hypothetical protein
MGIDPAFWHPLAGDAADPELGPRSATTVIATTRRSLPLSRPSTAGVLRGFALVTHHEIAVPPELGASGCHIARAPELRERYARAAVVALASRRTSISPV